jgi:hypothetical protein
MAAQPQLVIRRKPNLFGFGTKQKRPSVKRSSMTVSSATAAAYKAGQQSGDTGNFESWAEGKGLADRGPWLKKSYERGVEAGEATQSTGRPSGQRYSDRPISAKPFKDVSYKGYRIYHQGEGFRTSADKGESEFDDVKEAKRFIDDEAKMRRNPNATYYQLYDGAGYYRGVFDTKERAEIAARIKRIEKPKIRKIKFAEEKNPARITRRNSAEAADYAFEKFHGKPAGEEVFVETEEHVHEHLAVVGLLMEMRVDCVTGIEALLSFEDDPPYLCMTEDGQQLYIEAGGQGLDLKALGFEDKRWIKDRMVIGQFSAPGVDLRDQKVAKWNIGYQTEKDFDNFEEILYQHDLGEETSVDGKKGRVKEEDRVRPFLEYEPRNERLYITGGKYFISLPLIGTSPGIEN